MINKCKSKGATDIHVSFTTDTILNARTTLYDKLQHQKRTLNIYILIYNQMSLQFYFAICILRALYHPFVITVYSCMIRKHKQNPDHKNELVQKSMAQLSRLYWSHSSGYGGLIITFIILLTTQGSHGKNSFVTRYMQNQKSTIVFTYFQIIILLIHLGAYELIFIESYLRILPVLIRAFIAL